MSSTRCKRICSSLLALVLVLLLRTPVLAVSAGETDDPVTVRQWAAMLCEDYLDPPSEIGCVAAAYRRGWLPVTAVAAPESGLTEADTAKLVDVVNQTAGFTADQIKIIQVN